MKIGVALSGCDLGGAGAFAILKRLEREGLPIAMISASCIPAAPALLYAYGCEEEDAKEFYEEALSHDIDSAIDHLACAIPNTEGKARIPVVVGAAEVESGTAVLFTDSFVMDAPGLKTHPLTDPYDVLSSTISPMEGLVSYPLGGERLCDYAVWHGCPVHPLRMRGMDRVLALSFLPQRPQSPHQVLAKRKIEETGGMADCYVPIYFSAEEGWEKKVEVAISGIESCMKRIVTEMSLGYRDRT